MTKTVLKLKSGLAVLDVTDGRRSVIGQLNLDRAIDVVIRGKIVAEWGSDDGRSQEFQVEVKSIEAEVES